MRFNLASCVIIIFGVQHRETSAYSFRSSLLDWGKQKYESRSAVREKVDRAIVPRFAPKAALHGVKGVIRSSFAKSISRIVPGLLLLPSASFAFGVPAAPKAAAALEAAFKGSRAALLIPFCLWCTLFIFSSSLHAAEISITTLYPWKVLWGSHVTWLQGANNSLIFPHNRSVNSLKKKAPSHLSLTSTMTSLGFSRQSSSSQLSRK